MAPKRKEPEPAVAKGVPAGNLSSDEEDAALASLALEDSESEPEPWSDELSEEAGSEDGSESADGENEVESDDAGSSADDESGDSSDEDGEGSDSEGDEGLSAGSAEEDAEAMPNGRPLSSEGLGEAGAVTELPWWRTNPEIEPIYESDTSDEETGNTVGNIPLEWYADYPHIGYTVDGKKIMRPATGDALDKFLDQMDDPKSWRTFHDPYEGKDVVLTREELDLIKRLQGQAFGDSSVDPFEPTIEWYTSKVMETPLNAATEPKRRFIPSKWEGKRIMKIVRAIRKGWIVPRAEKAPKKPPVYMLWTDNDEERPDHPMHVPAPKMAPPEHNESYNPPAEYIPTAKEVEEWNAADPEDRPTNFIPKKHKNLRSVPAYTRLLNERFERCLDLYLCPRVRKQKIQMDPEALIPKLPDPKDLQPFPMVLAITYTGHTGKVRCTSADPTGRWLLSGSDDRTVRLWEVNTGRCWKTWDVEATVHSVAWNPNKALSVFAAAVGDTVLLVAPGIENEAVQTASEAIFRSESAAPDDKAGVVWAKPSEAESRAGIRVVLRFSRKVSSVVWHRKGDYFAVLNPDAPSSPISVHQLSKRQSQHPFRKSKGAVQKMLFHPTKPFLFVATQRYVRVYDLMKQELHKTLMSGVKWISSMDVHPQGDNVIVGSFDKRVCWFDMDLSSKPYRVLRSHDKAVRAVSFHRRYPLFASCSDDGTVQIFHGMVYNDLMQNPLIVPVKVLRGHEVADDLGVLGCEFHPLQPWIFSCGADGTVRLFS
ncbi:ribosome biogenesis protein BOP1 [Hyaloraphidium curvatum]|nr:ribosome biogenesis protein BOP1 [Hyaloraphidium curvatum]